MLYYLIEALEKDVAGLNALRYTTSRTGAAMLTALFLVFMFGPGSISLLKLKQGRGQPIRADGPQRHLVEKQGTPTMGGLMILSGIVVSTLIWADLFNLYVWAVLFVMLGFGAIGFYDDFLKVTKTSTPRDFRAGAGFYANSSSPASPSTPSCAIGEPALAGTMALPFFKDVLIPFGTGFILVGAFVIVGAGNAVNLTDGLDGLAIVPVMIAAGSYGVIVYLVGNAVFADYLQVHFVKGRASLRCLRRDHRRRARLPVVQRAPCHDLHGRHRLAVARRRARRHRRRCQA